MYGFGRSESILGEALAAHDVLDTAFVATKHFPVLPLAPLVRRTARASARRLGVSTIDLYQVHRPNPVVRDGTTMAGMRDLQDSGVVTMSGSATTRWAGGRTRSGRWAARCCRTRCSTASRTWGRWTTSSPTRRPRAGS